MNFDELQKQWQSQQAGFKLRIDADVLLKEVQRNKESFESTIFWRDVREAGGSLAAAPFLLYFAFKWIWSLCFTGLACIFVGAFMIIDRMIQKRKLPKPGDSLTGCIEISLAQVQHQIWLLKNVFWWYLLPFIIGIAIFWGHIGWSLREEWIAVKTVAWCFVGLTVICVSGYYFNQWAVRKYLIPRKQELEQLLTSLKNDNT